MCKTILLVVDGTACDRAMIEYVRPLAKGSQSRVILLHVENGEPRDRRRQILYPGATDAVEYLRNIQNEFRAASISVEIVLAYGEPAVEIKNQVQQRTCDLVMMNTQRRESVSEIFFGTIFKRVQNAIAVPILLFKSSR